MGERERFVRRALKRGRAFAARPHDLGTLHRLRRAVRGLRYALEWFGEDPTMAIEVQDALGTAIDRFVALREVERHGHGKGFRHHRRELDQKLRPAVRDAVEAWSRVCPALRG
jgi:CHAD domain-containing protein